MSTVGLCGVGVMGRAAASKIIDSGAEVLALVLAARATS